MNSLGSKVATILSFTYHSTNVMDSKGSAVLCRKCLFMASRYKYFFVQTSFSQLITQPTLVVLLLGTLF